MLDYRPGRPSDCVRAIGCPADQPARLLRLQQKDTMARQVLRVGAPPQHPDPHLSLVGGQHSNGLDGAHTLQVRDNRQKGHMLDLVSVVRTRRARTFQRSRTRFPRLASGARHRRVVRHGGTVQSGTLHVRLACHLDTLNANPFTTLTSRIRVEHRSAFHGNTRVPLNSRQTEKQRKFIRHSTRRNSNTTSNLRRVHNDNLNARFVKRRRIQHEYIRSALTRRCRQMITLRLNRVLHPRNHKTRGGSINRVTNRNVYTLSLTLTIITNQFSSSTMSVFPYPHSRLFNRFKGMGLIRVQRER